MGGGERVVSSHTFSFVLSLQQTALAGESGGGVQSSRLIPKVLCPARVLLPGGQDEPGENGQEGRRAGSWR